MRTTKQLLELMLKHKGLFYGGLCSWVRYLYDDDLILTDEYLLLKQHIKENKPAEICNGFYYWEFGKIAPRIEWINQQMLKLS